MTIEIIHRADDAGTRCALCRVEITSGHYAYEPGASVTIMEGESPTSSWRCNRPPTCTRSRAQRRAEYKKSMYQAGRPS